MLKRIIFLVLAVFISMNVIAYFHAFKLTNFKDRLISKTKDPKQLSAFEKGKTLLFGVSNPRPKNNRIPAQPFKVIKLQSNAEIEGWEIRAKNSKGTVIIFHGFSGQKSSMLDKSDEFLKLGYNTLLIDFMGSGGSEGNNTTIGFLEAQQVKSSFDYVTRNGERNIYLFGTSMGAVAILKAINDYAIAPAGIIIECPFGSMYQTVEARFKTMKIPAFPMAGLLVFWGGVQNGFWGFSHNPADYAKTVNCPVLLMVGGNDEKVSVEETYQIFNNFKGVKRLKIFPEAGHENYLNQYRNEWISEIKNFFKNRKITPTKKPPRNPGAAFQLHFTSKPKQQSSCVGGPF